MDSTPHPCSFAPLSVWAGLIIRNGGVPRRYWGRLARILAASALATPLRLVETVLYSPRVARVSVDHPPLFILGFARSGTTHLQNLLTRDARYGYFNTFQALTWPFSLLGKGWLQRIIEKGMEGMDEQTRPMDNVKVSMEAPQEEDLAVANATAMSFIHQLSFPQRSREMLDKYVLLGADAADDPSASLTPQELRRWDREYLRVVKKITMHAQGRPLILRNTVNTARVAHLLRLFPNAKFVHIVRNPYAVYPSLLHLYRKLLPLFQLDDYDPTAMDDLLMEAYARVMTKYLGDRELIPGGHLTEVRYEDLERDPLGELQRVYAEIELPGWEDAMPRIEGYLQTLSNYRKNRFQLDQRSQDRVRERWGFALDAWGYDLPETSV